MGTVCPWGVGAKTKATIVFEETYGVLPADIEGKVMPVNSNTVKRTQNLTDRATLTGDRNPKAPIRGNVDVSGDVVVPVDYKALGIWLKAMFDNAVSAAQYTLIGRYALTAAAESGGYSISKDGLNDGSSTISWEDVNTGWDSTYSSMFETAADGKVYRYTVDTENFTSFGKPAMGAFKHTFKLGNSMPSFTLEKAFPGIGKYARAKGCKISKFSMSVGGDGELTATISIVGKNEETVEAPLDADAPVAPLTPTDNFQAVIKIGDTIKGKITSFNIDIDFGLDTEGYVIGSNGERAAVCEGIAAISGSIEAFYDGDADLEQENTSAEVIFTNVAGEVLSIKLPEITTVASSPEISGPTGIKQQVNYSAFYENNPNGSAVVISLENDIEEY